MDTGANYVYTSSGWDKLSENFDFSAYITQQDAEDTFTTQEDFDLLVARVAALENNNNGNGGNQ